MSLYRRPATMATLAVLVTVINVTPSFSAPSGSDSAQFPRLTANVNVTRGEENPVRFNAIPSVLVDPQDPRRVFVSEVDLLSRTCRLHVSKDGGATFRVAEGNPLPSEFRFCFPNAAERAAPMAWARDGTLLMALNPIDPGTTVFTGPASVVVARSRDEGKTWEATVVQDSRNKPTRQASFGPYTDSAWQLHLASDLDRDRVYVGWGRRGVQERGVNKDDPVMRPVVAISQDGGRTFSQPVDAGDRDPAALAALTDFWRGGSLAVAPDGTVFDLYPESPPGLVAPIRPNLKISRSSDGAKSFEASTIAPRTAFTDWVELAAAKNPTGNGYVLLGVFEDLDPGASPPVQHIFMRRSIDGGQTWSDPRRLDDDPPQTLASQYMPEISVAPNGRIDVAWHDFRNDDGNFLSDVYYTYSHDAGATWAPNMRVTSASSNRHFGGFNSNGDVRGPVGLSSNDDAVYLSWDDTRNADKDNNFSDVYFAAVQHERTAVPASGPMWVVIAILAGLILPGAALLIASRWLRTTKPPPPVANPTTANAETSR